MLKPCVRVLLRQQGQMTHPFYQTLKLYIRAEPIMLLFLPIILFSIAHFLILLCYSASPIILNYSSHKIKLMA